MLQRFLLVWLTLMSAVAYFWPRWFPGAFDPFLATKDAQLIPWLIAGTMFCVGCLLTRDELADVFRRWPLVIYGTAIQYTAMPILGYVCSGAFGLDPDLRLGVIMVGCVPGAMASNVLTLLARGNVSYSVSLTTSSTLLSPIMVPLGLWLTLGKSVAYDPRQVAWELVLQVAGPVFVGHLLCRFWRRLEALAVKAAPLVANLAILWLIAVVVGLNRERLGLMFHPEYRAQSGNLLGALLAVNLLGYLAGYLGGLALGLSDPMRRALTLEIGMQNAGVGTSLVLRLFSNPAAAIPTALYTFGCMFTGTLLAQAWRWFGPVPGDEAPPVENAP